MKKLFTLLFLLSISSGFAQNILDTSAFAHKLDSIWYLESKLSLNYFEGNQSLFVGATDIVAGHSLGDSSAIWFIGGFNTVSSEGTSIRSSTYGHLRLFSSKRKAPIIAVLSLAQIARERGSIERYLGWSEGVFDWISTDLRSFAARMASSKLGSNNAK